MRQVERLINVHEDANLGDIYFVGERHRVSIEYKRFLSLEMAREHRREYDQSKEHWTYVGRDKTSLVEDYKWIKGERSKTLRDPSNGLYYASLKLEDDILVSDLYPRTKIKDIKEYLDEHQWSLKALNKLKMRGFEGISQYYGILPTREGYQIMDMDKKRYGCFESLEEAVHERDILVQKGVSL